MSGSSISDAFADITLSPGGGSNASAFNNLLTPQNSGPEIHPLQISTPEFGKRWGGMAFEKKQSVPSSIHSLDQLQQIMPKSYHCLQTIVQTQDAIFAGTITTIGSVILIHVKLQAQRRSIDVTLKSSSNDVCQREIENIIRVRLPEGLRNFAVIFTCS